MTTETTYQQAVASFERQASQESTRELLSALKRNVLAQAGVSRGSYQPQDGLTLIQEQRLIEKAIERRSS